MSWSNILRQGICNGYYGHAFLCENMWCQYVVPAMVCFFFSYATYEKKKTKTWHCSKSCLVAQLLCRLVRPLTLTASSKGTPLPRQMQNRRTRNPNWGAPQHGFFSLGKSGQNHGRGCATQFAPSSYRYMATLILAVTGNNTVKGT